MWGSSKEPPGTMEAGPPQASGSKNTIELNSDQLSVEDIVLQNKQSIRRKEQELEEYANKLSRIKTRTKRSLHREDVASSDSTPKSKSDTSSILEMYADDVDDISQARTPKAKSSLLQKKLAEDRKIFEQRSKEISESKRVAEEKVKAISQQLEDYTPPVVTPVLVTSQAAHPLLEISVVQDKDNKIFELNNKITELEAYIIDLQENLKEKDSVIESKTKAVTLISADLSEKGKTTLDTLEDTKDEMRSMQENFVLIESSLRDKNENLLKQLEDKSYQISQLEEALTRLNDEIETQKKNEIINADLSRSTINTLSDTKDEMKLMQENFVLIEESLKTKNDHLLQQLEDREIKLAEAATKILNLESGLGIEKQSDLEQLSIRLEKLEAINKKLEDEKYRLQKNIAELQNNIVSGSPNDDILQEKDNKIIELENLIEEHKKSHQQIQEDLRIELQKQIEDLKNRNDELLNQLTKMDEKVQNLVTENAEVTASLTEVTKDEETIENLKKELDELNKSMIKLKAQHKTKLKNLQKQLDNFKKVSDTNAELVKLGNQVAILEEEKGNLQLSLVDFDELKASAAEWKDRIQALEGKNSSQAKEIEAHIEAIAILENQKLDLIQELYDVKQEISELEAENAESENLRVTAEMKVVDLEEQLDKLQSSLTSDAALNSEIQRLTQENERLQQKLSEATATKSSSEVGSTESFVKTGSNVDSTESFEALSADAERADLLKKIDSLTRENGALLERLIRYEEKPTSDSGSTESFEKLPENASENLSRENQESAGKLIQLEERIQHLSEENERLLTQIQIMESDIVCKEKRSLDEESTSTVEPSIDATNDVNDELLSKIDTLTSTNEKMKTSLLELEKEKKELLAQIEHLRTEQQEISANEVSNDDSESKIISLESEIQQCRNIIAEKEKLVNEIKLSLDDKDIELNNWQKQSSFYEMESAKALEQLNAKIVEYDNLLVEHESVKAASEPLIAQLNEQRNEIQNLRNQIDDLLSQISAKSMHEKELLDEYEIKLQTLTGDYETKIQGLIKQHEERESILLDERDNEIRTIKETCNVVELQDKIVKLEEQLQQKSITIASLSEEIEKLMNNSSVIEEDLFTARHQLQNLNNKLEQSKSIDEYNEILSTVNDRELTILELTDKLNRKQDNIEALTSKIESVTLENKGLREKLSVEESKFDDIHEHYQIQIEEINDLKRNKADVENMLLNLQLTHEEALQHAKNLSAELQEAYKSLELLKNKHTEDMGMLNRRLEDVIEDLQVKTQELETAQIELNEKNTQLEKCVPDDVKSHLEGQLTQLQKALAEGEEKAQAQLEKMKKYAALAKKKNLLCEELENKMKEMIEKHNVELAESQAQNQKLENVVQERDNRITELEMELKNAVNERDQVLEELDILKTNLSEAHENIEELKKEIAELNTAKESARELGVRMSVMETEYVEQRTLINTLKTENGMLLSKQAQISERLENVEKESEERRQLLEKLEKEKEIAESEPKPAESCSRCANLEAKLQEREAEIENLDNELHNSIDNLVQMQESLRMNTVTDASYNELMQRYTALMSSNEETIAKLETTLRDNEELTDRINSLQSTEAALRETIQTLESELAARRSEAVVAVASDELVTSSVTEPEIKPFDASIFGSSSVSAQTNNELEFEIQRLTNELSFRLEEQRVAFAAVEDSLRTELVQSKATIEQLSSNLHDIDARLRSANKELNTLRLQSEKLASYDAENNKLSSQLEELLKEKSELEIELASLGASDSSWSLLKKLQKTLENYNVKIGETTSELEVVKMENQQLIETQQVHIRRVIELENELKTSGDNAIISELENRVSKLSQERDLLQLQFNDAKREYEDLKESTAGLSKLQLQLDMVVQERNQLVEEIKSLRASAASQETATQQQVPQQESIESLLSGSGWDDDVTPSSIETSESSEAQLKTRVDQLEEKLKDLSYENTKLVEESKVAQVKIVRYVKKLKEYKVQLDSLQNELKTSQTMGAFDDLNAAIEEELKTQVAALEKALSEAKEDLKKAAAEKEHLTNRIDVLTAASETLAETKTKQEHELHVWQMRYKEIEMKLQSTESGTAMSQVAVESKPENKIDHESSEFEALAKQNEELEQILEDYRVKMMSSEKAAMHAKELESSYSSLQASYDKLKIDYDALRRQFEQSLMDANDQVQNERQKCELLQITLEEKTMEAENLSLKLSAAIDEKTNAVDDMSKQLSVKTEQLAELEKDKAALEACTQNLEQQLTEKQLLVDQLQGLESSIDGYITGLQEGHAEIQALQDKLRTTEAEQAKVIQDLSEEVQDLRHRLSEATKQKDEMKELTQVQLNQCEGNSETIRVDLTKELEHIQDLLNQKNVEFNELSLERETLKTNIETLTRELSVRENELLTLQTENESLRVQIQAMNSEMADVREKYETELNECEMKTQLSLINKLEEYEKVQEPELEGAKPKVEEEIPIFTFAIADNKDEELKILKAELKAKDETIEHLQYSVNESMTTKMIQALQDNVNALHNEKAALEERLFMQNQKMHELTTQLEGAHQRLQANLTEVDSTIKLQQELHSRTEEVQRLSQLLVEKENQLRAVLETQVINSDVMQDNENRLREELFEKQQQLESFEKSVNELTSEVKRLREMEAFSANMETVIEDLKKREQERSKSEDALKDELRSKEEEIKSFQTYFKESLNVRDEEVASLKRKIEQISSDHEIQLTEKSQEVEILRAEITKLIEELNNLGANKESELQSLHMQLSEKESNLEQLTAMAAEEKKQLEELTKLLEMKEQQIQGLSQQLVEKAKEHELTQHALQRHVGSTDVQAQPPIQPVHDSLTEFYQKTKATSADSPSTANELDVALYMLHQRDMRCEELTQELMQLLEERDTLQLRLSDALRVSEQLRSHLPPTSKAMPTISSNPNQDSATQQSSENPMPSVSKEGKVEPVKEQPISHAQEALTQKLSELKTVRHNRDKTLKDDQEFRHAQQMSLLSHHEDLLKTLPPEAAARIVNANHTLSRDVQSQSSVLMNWLWGKSTPKVVHM
uniref:Protein lava lamp n=1 Tax=Trichogramma kaykai TaxID=54128 RepID=A0ABD2WLA6_9HYME